LQSTKVQVGKGSVEIQLEDEIASPGRTQFLEKATLKLDLSMSRSLVRGKRGRNFFRSKDLKNHVLPRVNP
jgi:hypothetical protein